MTKTAEQKRPRGRPRKNPISAEIIVKRPRGRSRKNSISTEIKVKRPRGRPKKNSISTNIVKDNNIFNNKSKLKSFENNENKNLVNINFASEITKCIISLNDTSNICKLYCGVLDSVEHSTSNMLVSCGFDKNNIVMPEIDFDTFKLHQFFGFTQSFYGNLENYALGVNQQQQFISWYFDTCGFIDKQKKGIFDVMENTNFCDESILAFTFCRSRTSIENYLKQKSDFFDELEQKLMKKNFSIHQKLLDYDYSGSKIAKREKSAHMNSIILRIIKKIL